MSAVICLSENILYLKTFQNNAPAILAYKLSTFETQTAEAFPKEEPKSLEMVLAQLEERLKRIEDTLPKKTTGGAPEWQTQI